MTLVKLKLVIFLKLFSWNPYEKQSSYLCLQKSLNNRFYSDVNISHMNDAKLLKTTRNMNFMHVILDQIANAINHISDQFNYNSIIHQYNTIQLTIFN